MMLKSFKNIVFGLVAASISVSAVAQNDRALDLDALLQQLEEGKFAQTQQNKQREQEFMAQRAEQDARLGGQRQQLDALGEERELAVLRKVEHSGGAHTGAGAQRELLEAVRGDQLAPHRHLH